MPAPSLYKSCIKNIIDNGIDYRAPDQPLLPDYLYEQLDRAAHEYKWQDVLRRLLEIVEEHNRHQVYVRAVNYNVYRIISGNFGLPVL